jgi:TonB family protein
VQVATYAAAWRHVIRQNAPFEQLQGAKTGPYENPVVTVAVRSDGSLESVAVNRSSGIAGIDEAVRRIVEALAPFPPFPPELEMDCDVIEIPSIWSFDRALRLIWRGQ